MTFKLGSERGRVLAREPATTGRHVALDFFPPLDQRRLNRWRHEATIEARKPRVVGVPKDRFPMASRSRPGGSLLRCEHVGISFVAHARRCRSRPDPR